jgi:hypothetical protein
MSNNNAYKVQDLSPAEVREFLARRNTPSHLGKPLKPEHRKIVMNGFELKGEFELTARDARSGEVEWEVKQENLLTDIGRQNFFEQGLSNLRLGFAPSQETPSILRCAVPTDGSQCFVSGNLGSGAVTPSTYTKQWSTTFGVPVANRTLGIIWTTFFQAGAPDGNMGLPYIWSYSLLTPPKTQTTVQTLEVIYKLSLNPIW